MYKKLILYTLMIILLNISIVNAEELDEIYTWQDLKSYAEQIYNYNDYFDRFSTSYTSNLKNFTYNFIYNFDYIINICNQYGYNISLTNGVIIRNNRSGNNVNMFVYFINNNTVATQTSTYNIQLTNISLVNFIWNYNDYTISFNSSGNGRIIQLDIADASGYQNFGLTNGILPIYKNSMLYENQWIYFTPLNGDYVEVSNNNLKLGYQRTGQVYFNSNLIYELINEDLLLSVILNYDNNNIFFNSSYIYDLYLPAVDNIKNSKNYYINIIDENNKTIYKSNDFEINVTNNANNNSIIQNASGEVIGSINNDNIINSINNLNNTQNEFNNRFFNNSISGDLTTPQINLENPGEQFYMNIYNNIVNGLKNEDVQYIDLVLFNGDTYRIYSNSMQWSVPGLDEFIYIIWWGGFGYAFFKLVYWTYEKVSQGDIMGLINEIENDKDIL